MLAGVGVGHREPMEPSPKPPCSRNAPTSKQLPTHSSVIFFKGREEEPLTTAENKLLLASSACVRVRLVQLLAGVLPSLPKQVVPGWFCLPLGAGKAGAGFQVTF